MDTGRLPDLCHKNVCRPMTRKCQLDQAEVGIKIKNIDVLMLTLLLLEIWQVEEVLCYKVLVCRQCQPAEHDSNNSNSIPTCVWGEQDNANQQTTCDKTTIAGVVADKLFQ
jgi:hypothetical protein